MEKFSVSTPKESLTFLRNLKVAFRLIGIDCTSNGDALVIMNVVDCVREHNGNPSIADLAESIEKAKDISEKIEAELYKNKEE